MEFEHFLLTRFDYPADYPHFQKRLDLFRRYTLPSVLGQSNRRFTWAIRTKHPEVRALISNLPGVKCCDSFGLPTDAEWILTTRLDNDDAVSPGFIAAIQKAAEPRASVIDSRGFRLRHGDGLCVKFDYYGGTRCSPFVTLVERSRDMRGVMAFKHGHIGQTFPVVRLSGRHWCQVIHGTNKLMDWKPGFPKAGRPEWI